MLNDGASFRAGFTKSDDTLLMKYIAVHNPELEGRQGNRLYRDLCDSTNARRWSFAKNHPWQSWQNRYKKNKEAFDKIIAEYQVKKQSDKSRLSVNNNQLDTSQRPTTTEHRDRRSIGIGQGEEEAEEEEEAETVAKRSHEDRGSTSALKGKGKAREAPLPVPQQHVESNVTPDAYHDAIERRGKRRVLKPMSHAGPSQPSQASQSQSLQRATVQSAEAILPRESSTVSLATAKKVPERTITMSKRRIHRQTEPASDDYGGAIDKSESESGEETASDPADAQIDTTAPADVPLLDVRLHELESPPRELHADGNQSVEMQDLELEAPAPSFQHVVTSTQTLGGAETGLPAASQLPEWSSSQFRHSQSKQLTQEPTPPGSNTATDHEHDDEATRLTTFSPKSPRTANPRPSPAAHKGRPPQLQQGPFSLALTDRQGRDQINKKGQRWGSVVIHTADPNAAGDESPSPERPRSQDRRGVRADVVVTPTAVKSNVNTRNQVASSSRAQEADLETIAKSTLLVPQPLDIFSQPPLDTTPVPLATSSRQQALALLLPDTPSSSQQVLSQHHMSAFSQLPVEGDVHAAAQEQVGDSEQSEQHRDLARFLSSDSDDEVTTAPRQPAAGIEFDHDMDENAAHTPHVPHDVIMIGSGQIGESPDASVTPAAVPAAAGTLKSDNDDMYAQDPPRPPVAIAPPPRQDDVTVPNKPPTSEPSCEPETPPSHSTEGGNRVPDVDDQNTLTKGNMPEVFVSDYIGVTKTSDELFGSFRPRIQKESRPSSTTAVPLASVRGQPIEQTSERYVGPPMELPVGFYLNSGFAPTDNIAGSSRMGRENALKRRRSAVTFDDDDEPISAPRPKRPRFSLANPTIQASRRTSMQSSVSVADSLFSVLPRDYAPDNTIDLRLVEQDLHLALSVGIDMVLTSMATRHGFAKDTVRRFVSECGDFERADRGLAAMRRAAEQEGNTIIDALVGGGDASDDVEGEQARSDDEFNASDHGTDAIGRDNVSQDNADQLDDDDDGDDDDGDGDDDDEEPDPNNIEHQDINLPRDVSPAELEYPEDHPLCFPHASLDPSPRPAAKRKGKGTGKPRPSLVSHPFGLVYTPTPIEPADVSSYSPPAGLRAAEFARRLVRDRAEYAHALEQRRLATRGSRLSQASARSDVFGPFGEVPRARSSVSRPRLDDDDEEEEAWGGDEESAGGSDDNEEVNQTLANVSRPSTPENETMLPILSQFSYADESAPSPPATPPSPPMQLSQHVEDEGPGETQTPRVGWISRIFMGP